VRRKGKEGRGAHQVVVCSIMEYRDVASMYCECVHFADRQGVVMRMKMNEIRSARIKEQDPQGT
jgi:hypothetical protein